MSIMGYERQDLRNASELELARQWIAEHWPNDYDKLSRKDRIITDLNIVLSRNDIHGWMLYSPDGRRRWVVNGYGWERTFTTADVETWLEGYYQGLETW